MLRPMIVAPTFSNRLSTIGECDGYVPGLSLVADDYGDILGHIMLSYVRLEEFEVLELAPLSVKPGHQRIGIGDALTRDALLRADEAMQPLVLVLGHAEY